MWSFFFVLGRFYDEPVRAWKKDDIQVRVMTVGTNREVIQRTVDTADQYFDDIHVVSEEKVDIRKAEVHVVPESFESDAIRKGRASDWAVKNIDHDREYNLYLDEDTIVTGFDGIPDFDIVQFLELPQYNGSYLTYLTEVSRVGYQNEMMLFPYTKYPPYLWGGAVAIRTDVEKDVGWERESITEDTAFLWEAVNNEASLGITKQWYKNQSPPNIRSLIEQRRRWVAGTIQGLQYLPLVWKLIVSVRTIMWVFSMLTLYVIIVGFVIEFQLWLMIVLFIPLVAWSIIGTKRYDRRIINMTFTIVLFPIIHTINAVGVLYGITRPPEDFEVTEKK
jgi:hypothetical protein